MFGKPFIKNRNYCLLAVRKNNILHCASYDKDDDNNEVITSINTGEKYYSLSCFVRSVIGLKSINEFKECLYYNHNKKRWRSIRYILKNF
jgi:hypothetical protein